MKKILLYVALLFASANIWSQVIDNSKTSGWLESAFVQWAPVAGADSYNVYYTGGGETNKKIDTQLIRNYGTYFRADVPGLAAGSYTLTVKPVTANVEGTGSTTSSLTVLAHDRWGFGFANGRVPGAYKADGTPKTGAVILYISQNTKNTISATITGATTNPCVGLQNILYGIKKGKDLRPFIIRFIGNITDPAVLEGGDIVIENDQNAASYITLEGIGDDAVANGFGIRLKTSSNVEIRNLGLMLTNASEGDNIGLQQDNDYTWIHNCDLFYGSAGGDADQAKGDGAMDAKKSTYITFSYNHFWDSGKCNLLGLSENTTTGLYITYHHNWYDHSDSRHPRVRFYSAHVYNNYYDGNSKYGAGSTEGSSVFMESNFFRNCKYPMLTSMQGTDVFGGAEGTFSGEDGGTIKAFNNVMIGQMRYVPYNATTNPIEFDAIEVATRNETISASITSKQGAKTYNNFDTNSAIMYAYTPDSPAVAKDNVMLYSGRIQGGDLKFTFNNATDDTSSAVNSAMMSALTSYTTKLVAIQGETAPVSNQILTIPNNNNQTVSAGNAIAATVFTWGGDATDANVTDLPAGLSSTKNTTNKTITITGTPTANGTYTVTTSGTGTPASGTGTITVTAASTHTLSSPTNKNQTVTTGTAIGAIVFTWGGDATDANATGLPAGITSTKDSGAKTITITGTPTAAGTYTITTVGTGTSATGSGTISISTATAGDQIHNFTSDGKNSTFYTIIGNLSTTKGTVNYEGLTLTQCLKMETATTITYTTTQPSTLTLVFVELDGSAKVDGIDRTATNGIITLSLAAGSHTIAKKNADNLFYMKTAYATLGIENNIQSPKLTLYPNPATNQLYFSSSDQKINTVTIYNLTGALVKTISNVSEAIDVSNLSNGSYLVKVTTDKGSFTQKIIKN
ncbi:T9SS type A sorting domain-containing protein [Flavobacterium eburneipallidum]|uniref:pectate lyase family protein n=1 Tax=Flavobacterium eburneipallidum TaxID=3003263 RepID=UPI00248260B3|nr:T9SS type A sorting domain-containing protein [Flavobacterium eburneipallidum]